MATPRARSAPATASHGRHPRGAAAEWRTRAILELETDRPWFERMRDAYLARLASEAR